MSRLALVSAQPPIQWVSGAPSIQYSAKVTNKCSYISTPAHAFMECTEAIFFRLPSYGIYRRVGWYININTGCEAAASETLVIMHTKCHIPEDGTCR
jgi:hypothetical protein